MDRREIVTRFIEEHLRRVSICGITESGFKQIGEIKDIFNSIAENTAFDRDNKTIERDFNSLKELFDIDFIKGEKLKEFKLPDLKKKNVKKYKTILRFYLALINLSTIMQSKEIEDAIDVIINSAEYPLENIVNLFMAITAHKPVYINYLRKYDNEYYEFEVYPYEITYRWGKWLLVCYNPVFKDFRHYLVNHIKSVTVNKDKTFQRDNDFSLEEFYSTSLRVFRNTEYTRTYKIEFKNYIAENLEDYVFIPDYKVEKRNEKSVLISFDADSEIEVMNWVFTFGTDAEIIEPKSTRKAMKQRIKELKKVY